MNKSNLTGFFILLFLIHLTTDLFAKAEGFNKTYYDILALFLVGILILIFIGFLYFGMGEGKSIPERKGGSLLARIRQILTASTPIEKEQDIDLGHDYDDIRELDNRVPPWFSYLFYITILFAIYYMLDYHVFRTSLLQEEEYAQEVQEAEQMRAELIKSGALINEETVTLLTDQASISSGELVYESYCVACHRKDGGGLIGPNLTDDFWIHGGSIKDIFKTIKYGVPAKGMISWQTQLNPRQMQEVTSYIFTLVGTNPQNPKAPEGNKYSPADTSKIVAVK